MTLAKAIEVASNYGWGAVGVLVILSMVVEVSKIQINPWSALFGWIGRKMTKHLDDRFDAVETKVREIGQKLDEHVTESQKDAITSMRALILDFGSAIAEGKRSYTKEQYEFIISICDDYEEFIEQSNITNGVAETTIAIIKESYAEKLKSGSFVAEKETHIYFNNRVV